MSRVARSGGRSQLDQLTFSSEGKAQPRLDGHDGAIPAAVSNAREYGQAPIQRAGSTVAWPNSCLVLGRWHLTRDSEQLEGNFSLVFRLIDGRWQIVHDHTSRLRDAE